MFLKDVQVGLVATIIDLRLDRGWSYMACTRCAKKVIPDGQAYFCVNCEAIVKFVVPRLVNFNASTKFIMVKFFYNMFTL